MWVYQASVVHVRATWYIIQTDFSRTEFVVHIDRAMKLEPQCSISVVRKSWLTAWSFPPLIQSLQSERESQLGLVNSLEEDLDARNVELHQLREQLQAQEAAQQQKSVSSWHEPINRIKPERVSWYFWWKMTILFISKDYFPLIQSRTLYFRMIICLHALFFCTVYF